MIVLNGVKIQGNDEVYLLGNDIATATLDTSDFAKTSELELKADKSEIEEIKLQIAEILKKLDPSSLIDEPEIQKD